MMRDDSDITLLALLLIVVLILGMAGIGVYALQSGKSIAGGVLITVSILLAFSLKVKSEG